MGLFTVKASGISAKRRAVAGSIPAPSRIAKALRGNTH
jgi:hypothetical protein